MFKKVGTIIGDANLAKRQSSPVAAISVRLVARDVIFSVCADLPPEVLETIKIVSWRNFTITIKAPAMLCAELEMRSGELLEEINKSLGKKAVSRLRFKIS